MKSEPEMDSGAHMEKHAEKLAQRKGRSSYVRAIAQKDIQKQNASTHVLSVRIWES